MDYDRDRLSELVKQAQGTRTQTQFAKEAGISAAHIGRMRRGLLTTRPKKNTLENIAIFSEGDVSLEDLLDAAGYETYNSNKVNDRSRRNQYLVAIINSMHV